MLSKDQNSKSLEHVSEDIQTLFFDVSTLGLNSALHMRHQISNDAGGCVLGAFIHDAAYCQAENIEGLLVTINDFLGELLHDGDQVGLSDFRGCPLDTLDGVGFHFERCILEMGDEGGTDFLFH